MSAYRRPAPLDPDLLRRARGNQEGAVPSSIEIFPDSDILVASRVSAWVGRHRWWRARGQALIVPTGGAGAALRATQRPLQQIEWSKAHPVLGDERYCSRRR